MYIKLKGLHTAYTGATAGIADISTGSLFFGVIIHQGQQPGHLEMLKINIL